MRVHTGGGKATKRGRGGDGKVSSAGRGCRLTVGIVPGLPPERVYTSSRVVSSEVGKQIHPANTTHDAENTAVPAKNPADCVIRTTEQQQPTAAATLTCLSMMPSSLAAAASAVDMQLAGIGIGIATATPGARDPAAPPPLLPEDTPFILAPAPAVPPTPTNGTACINPAAPPAPRAPLLDKSIRPSFPASAAAAVLMAMTISAFEDQTRYPKILPRGS